ncbi:sulfotransferase [Idiomarina sp.]|uniref:sulfotransferase n=1 Tax=Idiomarina sp. TaxID=1874361 RepID=UPI001E102296|nr:sulfotransferase [Idiomarina sp.]MCJ8316219.1 sulfotransferase [Idiomarina sp.]NQZ16132.1 sulfotransferase [Idiomarina sp.]
MIKKVIHRVMNMNRKVISPIIRVWENGHFNTQGAKAPVFIIGAPRTGSTILYQALTNAYEFAYIDNLACSWHRNLRFGMMKSWKAFGNRPHNNFKAEHGDTKRFGGHAPSECGEFWYRWLPKDRHFVDYDDISDEMVRDIRREVLGASSYLRRPLLFKNLNAGQRLRLIHRCFPNAKIIVVRRDPRFVVRSIVRARHKVGIPPNQWWSIMPPNFAELMSLPEGQMCAAQIYYIEKQIDEDLRLFNPKNVKHIHYQEFNNRIINDIANWVGVEERADGSVPLFSYDDVESLNINELNNLNDLVKNYELKKELFV